jgi:uncharacterized protein
MRKTVVALTLFSRLAFAADSPPDSTQLFQAVRGGDISFLKSHLTKSALEVRDQRGATLLMHAAAFGNIETLKLLADAGADINARNDFGATALLWGARDPEKAKLLISRGADVNARSTQGRTPLMLASLRPGGSSIVALMLTKGADVNNKDNHGETALGLAATIGDVETMRLLLAKGADPSAANGKGETPIILATKSKQAEAVRLLIAKRVDVNVANTSNNAVRKGRVAMIKLRPLHRAAAFGPVEMVRDLLQAGADVNARDSRELTPLIFAVATEYPDPRIIRTLLDAEADVNARDNMGETALDWAERFGYPEVIAALKKVDARHGVAYEAPKRPEGPRPDATLALSRGISLLQKQAPSSSTRAGASAATISR